MVDIDAPTPEDMARDAAEDMAMCDHVRVMAAQRRKQNAEAPPGMFWPTFMGESELMVRAWIRRAIAAETELAELKEEIRLEALCYCPKCGENEYRCEYDTGHQVNVCSVCRHKWDAE